jgi:hypothetical protein
VSLDGTPPVADAYYAGFDATGGAVQGGYTIDHALSLNKQFTTWYGQAYPLQQSDVLQSQFVSNFWEVVNQMGAIGPGASGSGLFDQNNRLVGTLSLGRTTAAGDAYGSCPASPLAAPNGTNGAADFVQLSAVWNSTADTTSSTGAVTLKSVLDPGNTGTLVVDSMPTIAPLTLTPANYTAATSTSDVLTWNAPGAVSCTASGGNSGDGWPAGAVSASSSVGVSEQATGTDVYKLTCSYPGNRSTNSRVSINWTTPAPFADWVAGDQSVWVGAPNRIDWKSNVPGTCTLRGGSANLSNLPTSGSATVTESSAGMVHYTLTCGSGTNSATASRDDQYVAPTISFTQGNSDLLLGEIYSLQWQSLADTCTPTGGTSGDNWGGAQLGANGNFFPAITAVGTYTYGLTCTAGTVSASATATVTVENNAPYATLIVSPSTLVTGQPVTVTWKSNLFFCDFTGNPIGANDTVLQTAASGSAADGTATLVSKYPNTWTFALNCGNGIMGRTALSPGVTIKVLAALDSNVSISPTSVTVGQPFSVSWQANNASSCGASGGGADGTMWTGSQALPHGSKQITPTAQGTFTYTLACIGQVPSDVQTTQATVTVTAQSSGGGASGGGGGGGGGEMDRFTLAALVLLWLFRSRKPAAP